MVVSLRDEGDSPFCDFVSFRVTVMMSLRVPIYAHMSTYCTKTMPEDIQQHTSDPSETDVETTHTCACGEQHPHKPGSTSHREECTSEKKFGNSCCCGSGAAAQEKQHRCGHGPRCQ
jgi:hypothetical protein